MIGYCGFFFAFSHSLTLKQRMTIGTKNQTGDAPVFRNIVLALAGFSAWAMGDAVVRYLKDMEPFVLSFGVSLVAFLISVILSPWLGGLRQTTHVAKNPLVLWRGLLLACSNICAVFAFMNLPLTTAYAIIFIAPLVAKLLSSFLMGEIISLRLWLLSLLGFAGVLLAVRPGVLPMNIGTVAAFCLVFFFASGQVLSRKIGKDNQTFLSFVCFQYGFTVLIVAPFALGHIADLSLSTVLILALVGVTSVFGGLGVAAAYASAPTAVIAPMHYVQILWGAVLGAVLFGEYPDTYTIIGAVVIIIAGLLLIKNSR